MVSAPFTIVSGEYAVVPNGADNNGDGELVFSIYCSQAASGIRFEAYALAGGPQDDSFFVQFDSEEIQWHLTENFYNVWNWGDITKSAQKLEWSIDADAGMHAFRIKQREDGTMIKAVRFLGGHPTCSFKATCDESTSLFFNLLGLRITQFGSDCIHQ